MRIDRAIRDSGVLDALQPAAQLRQHQAVAVVVDPAGAINRAAILPHLPPITFRWAPSDGTWWPVPVGIRLIAGWARAETEPSGGDCVITISYETHRDGESEGITTVTPSLTITSGKRFGEAVYAVDLPAGAWIQAVVSTASSASGVSIAMMGAIR